MMPSPYAGRAVSRSANRECRKSEAVLQHVVVDIARCGTSSLPNLTSHLRTPSTTRWTKWRPSQ
jgi:hypothetical protein